MHATINHELNELEKARGARVLFACESGSRAWGFASPDSDYDARFVYAHDLDWYLGLENRRDVIEWKLDDVLDINGWDLAKFLRLMRGSNPTVFEWLASPIVYRELSAFAQVRSLTSLAFQPKPSIYHYLRMARRNYEDFLLGKTVKTKKYFYVIRPLLAARWVIDERTPSPMRFDELAAAKLDPTIEPLVSELLHEKVNEPERETRPRIDALNTWIEGQIADIKAELATMETLKKPSWEPFDDVFRDIVVGRYSHSARL